jgi:hypothetical protein
LRSLAVGGGLLVLLAVVALAASRGSPGGTGSGEERSLPLGILDVIFTLALVGGVLTIVFMLTSMRVRREDDKDLDLRAMLLAALAVVAFFCLVAGGAYLLSKRGEPRSSQVPSSGTAAPFKTGTSTTPSGEELRERNAQISWWTVGVVTGALVVLGGATYGRLEWSRRRARRRERETVEAVREVLQQALEDLEGGDARSAVIRAYAAMERTLAAAGIPRRPADAPWEFVRRALTELHASAEAAQELTELFERAKFSDHELGEHDRTAAVRALRAVRDELELEAA